MAGVFQGSARVIAMLSAQRETHVANLCLQERVEQIRGTSYPQITDPTYVQGTLMTTGTTSAAVLSAPTETLTLSAYPVAAGGNLQVRRQGGSATLVTTNATLGTAAAVRADFSLDWTSKQGSRSRSRQIIFFIAKGGINN